MTVRTKDVVDGGLDLEAPTILIAGPNVPKQSTPPDCESFADVQEEPVEWAWKDRIPFGFVTLIEGDTTAGKTTVVCDLVARWTRDTPDPSVPVEPLRVLWLSKEDSPSLLIKPRLVAAGAVLANVIRPKNDAIARFPGDLEKLCAAIDHYGARVVVIDPLNSYFAGKANDEIAVRNDLMDPLNSIAQSRRLVILAMRHLGKNSGERQALHRGLGSTAYMAAARAPYLLSKDPDDKDARILACSKLQVALHPPALRLRIVSAGKASRIEWTGTSTLTADELGQPQAQEGSSLGEAMEWLRTRLAVGPIAAKLCYRESAKDGISDRTLRRAKDKLEVASKRAGDEWVWRLPD